MKYRLALLVGSFIGGVLLSILVGGPALGVIYAILWADKILLGWGNILRYFGIEFTTLMTVLLGMIYGPTGAFIYTIIVIPFFHGVKFLALPLYEPDWPLFVPHYYNFVDATGAAVAGIAAGLGLFWVMVLVLITRGIMYPFIDYYLLDRGINFFTIPPTAAFNLIMVWYFGSYFFGLVGL